MRKEGVKDFQIDWTKFDGQRKQYKEEANYAKEAGKIGDLVCYRALSKILKQRVLTRGEKYRNQSNQALVI